MKHCAISLLILFLCALCWSYEIPDENEVVTRTCSLSVKLEVIPDPEMKRQSGRAKVSVFLGDRDGLPHAFETLELTATLGTFMCKLPEDTTETDKASKKCFTTAGDGFANIYLVNIPFNKQVRVKAQYDCGEYIVTGNATLAIRRGKVTRKKKIRLRH